MCKIYATLSITCVNANSNVTFLLEIDIRNVSEIMLLHCGIPLPLLLDGVLQSRETLLTFCIITMSALDAHLHSKLI
jgi:hypothetical protein